jgi:hypothetical protein
MSCEPTRPCGPGPAGLGLAPPPPGQRALARRLGDFDGFRRELIAAVEHQPGEGAQLGRIWDLEGDPAAALIASLWAYVAEGVAAYTELTAAEAYLETASAWMSLRRLGEGVGYRPRPRIAAQGWVRCDVERGAEPVVPAGTRVQAPGTPARAAQTFEAVADTQLRSEWNAMTATWVPVAAALEKGSREVRFLGDPGFRLGDRVLFVRERPQRPRPTWVNWDLFAWTEYWSWLLALLVLPYDRKSAVAQPEPLAVATVSGRRDELGTTLVEFDRDLSGLLSSATESYAAYRVAVAAGSARRLEKVLRFEGDGIASNVLSYEAAAVGDNHVVLDVALDELSKDQSVAIVDWTNGNCNVEKIKKHEPIEWEVAPGTPIRASRLEFESSGGRLAALPKAGPVSVYVVDRRVLARHYRFPSEQPPGPPDQPPGPPQRLRLYPAPETAPSHIAVELDLGGRAGWQVFGCAPSAESLQEEADPDLPGAPRGLIVDLDRHPEATLAGDTKARASGNLVAVRHGTTTAATIGSGDATQPGQRITEPDRPIAYDLDPAGNVVPSQVLRVDGVQWREVPTLYGEGSAEQAFAARLGPEGEIELQFGDGECGARLPSGRNNVSATYRVGGGSAGEVESGAISTLVGSIRGVRRVAGAGPTTGGADQDDERRLRKLVPARARAFDRAISTPDLVDLALGYPGVSHAAAWHGAGVPGCACGGSGLHLAFLRAGSGGTRAPEPAEISSLSSFLDARRDTGVALCVCAALLSAVTVSATIATDPRREPGAVLAAAAAALVAAEGPLSTGERALGEALDRSDLDAALHAVAGVVGVVGLDLPGADPEIGRRAAERFELIALAEPNLRAEAV